MRLGDIVRMALQTIRQQRARTALSCAGVVIGSLMLIVGLAAKEGVQHAVTRVFSMGDRMRRISVTPVYTVKDDNIPPEAIQVAGEMSDERRARIQQRLKRQWQSKQTPSNQRITTDQLAAMAAVDHVAEIVPRVTENCRIRFDDTVVRSDFAGASPNSSTLHELIVAGDVFASPTDQSIVLHEFVTYQLGFHDESAAAGLVGKTLRLEIRHAERAMSRTLAFRSGSKLELSDEDNAILEQFVDRIPDVVENLPLSEQEKAVLKKAFRKKPVEGTKPIETLVEEEYTIVGIYRGRNEDERRYGRWSDLNGEPRLVLPAQTATSLVQRIPGVLDYGFEEATVIVDSEDNLKDVMTEIQKLDVRTSSLLDFVEAIKSQVATVTLVLSALAVIALFVSALGITNTMVMTVVERTHEIGVMKAVGARDGHILLLFLFESALIGLLGAGVAVLIGWLAAYPLDSYVRSILDRRLDAAFVGVKVIFFPYWLAFAVPAFAMVVTTLAGVLPARRAARISPIVALRHE